MTQSTDKKLPFSLYFSFGIGSLGTATVLNSTSVLLLFFMTNLLGISAWIGGVLLFVSKVVDVVSNPIVGVISDKTSTPMGRRRPYLLAGGLCMTLTFILLFNIPQFESGQLTVVYLLTVLTLLSLGYAIFAVPYLAIAAEMTENYHERTTIMSYRVFFILVGSLVGVALAPAIATPSGVGTMESFGQMGLLLGGIVLLATMWSFWGIRKARFFQPDQHNSGFVDQLRIAAQNTPFVLLGSAKFLQLIAVASVITCTLYLTQYVLKLDGLVTASFFLTMTLSSVLSVPIWTLVTKRLDKHKTYIGAVIMYAVATMSWLFAAEVQTTLDLVLVYMRAVFMGVPSGGLILLGVSMLPDTIEFDRKKSGIRREGIFTGVWSTIEKGATAIGALIIGIVLDLMGFVEATGEVVAQPESALVGIIIGVSVVPALFMLVSLVFLTRYRLTHEVLNTIPEPAAS